MPHPTPPPDSGTARAWTTLMAAMACLGPAVSPVAAQGPDVRVILVEPAGVAGADDAAVYRLVTDTVRIREVTSWMANPSARMALDLFSRAWALTPEGQRGEPPVYYVALVPGGNHAAVGLRLLGDPDPEAHAHTSYIKLAPEDWVFSTTLLHETGHVILSLLNGGAEIPRQEIAAISHTTAALTDRGTAFDEGFAIHLETLAAHFTSDPFLRDRYHHRRFRFGAPEMLGEFHRHAGDLLSFSQTVARYYEVRENNFAFAPAYTGPDYLRVQLEKSRDFATLRDPDQLLQSEGFHASFFFSLLMRGREEPTIEVVRDRQQHVLEALAETLRSRPGTVDDPLLLLLVQTYLRKFPAEAGEVIDVLLDLSHGVFVDDGAEALWRKHYLGALHLDLAERNNDRIEAARSRWHEETARNPGVLFRRLGPQLRVELEGPTVELVAFGESRPVSFDINTVEPGVIRLVPGIREAEVSSWLEARNAKPFAGAPDFRRRSGLGPGTLAQLHFK